MAPGSRPDLFALRRRPLGERWLDLGFQRAVVALAAVVGLLLAGILITVLWTPPEPQVHATPEPAAPGALRQLLLSAELMRLNWGVFVLYAVQIATWVGLPFLLVQ